MPLGLQFFAFLAAAYAISIVVWYLPSERAVGWWLHLGGSCAVLLTPLLISSQHVMLRAMACVLAIELFFKTLDYWAQLRAGTIRDRRLVKYFEFLIPFPVLLVCFGSHRCGFRFGISDCIITVFSFAVFVLSCVGAEVLSGVEMIRSSFLVDHSVKLIVFVVAIESLSLCMNSLERIAGYEISPIVNSAFCSRTVGEFWNRYNTRVHTWFEQHVFKRGDGRRKPIRSILLTFFISGVLHEIGFAIATSRIDGYQFAFFMLQVPAVVLGHLIQRPLQTHLMGVVMLHVSTIVWMWVTSMLFFHGVNRVFPYFYAATPWLP